MAVALTRHCFNPGVPDINLRILFPSFKSIGMEETNAFYIVSSHFRCIDSESFYVQGIVNMLF